MEREHATAAGVSVKRLLALTVAIALLACGACSRTASRGAFSGGAQTFSYTEGEDIDTLNPLMTTELAVTDLSVFTQGFFFLFDRGAGLIPSLCLQVPTKENGLISADGKRITYRLRRGVRWQDGAPFTAADVAFTVKTILDPHFNDASTIGYDDIASLQTPNAATVVVHLKRPDAAFVSQFLTPGIGSGILPKHLLAGVDVNHAAWNALPVGLGPFKYTRWLRDSEVDMVANDRWWGGKPKLREVIYRIIPDANTAVNELRTGELDAFGRIPNETYLQAKAVPGTRTIDFATTGFEHLDFNMSNPIFADRRVREAIASDIDRAAIVRTVDHGSGFLSCSPIPHWSWAYDAHLSCPDFDPARARALLDAAGWRVGPDGIRRKNGVELRLDLASTAGNQAREETAVILQAAFRRVGIALSFHPYQANELFANQSGVLSSGRYDLSLYSWFWGGDPDLSPLYACDQRPPQGQNFSRYCNPRFDALLSDATLHYNQARRRADYVAAQQLFAHDLPSVVIYQRIDHLTASSRFTHLDPGAQLLFTHPARIAAR